MREVRLSCSDGLVALVDDEDFERVNSRDWFPLRARGGWIYAQSGQYPNVVLMHRLILNVRSAERVSHRNKNGLDNQKSNLRIATHRQSMQSHRKHSNNKSGYKGVYFDGPHRVRPWCAQISVNGQKIRRYHLSEVEAAKTYDELARRHFGEFAVVNFQ